MNQTLLKQTQKSKINSYIQTQDMNQNITPYMYANSIPLDDYVHHLRYKVFPGVDTPILKEFLYYLFHFDRSNEILFNNFHTFIAKRDIFGALNFLKSVINIEEVKRKLQDTIMQYGIMAEETKDLNTILDLYVETEEPSLAQKLFRYLLYIEFESREAFDHYIAQYLSYANDDMRYMSISDYIYSAYNL
jgi:hypothetical protein